MSQVETERPRVPVLLAVFGAIYLIYIVAWLFAVRSNQLVGIDDRFIESMSKFGEFFAIVSPALFFFTVLTQIRSTRWRITVLSAGLVFLFPFPLFFGVPAL